MSVEKICNICKISKPLDEFYKVPAGKFGVWAKCIICAKAKYKKYIEENKEHVKAIQTKSKEKRKLEKPNDKFYNFIRAEFQMTPDEYEAIRIKQNFKCALCNRSEFEFKKRLHLDHCHSSNQVRGLLCSKCNMGLGLFKDNIEVLQKAIIYLQHYDHN